MAKFLSQVAASLLQRWTDHRHEGTVDRGAPLEIRIVDDAKHRRLLDLMFEAEGLDPAWRRQLLEREREPDVELRAELERVFALESRAAGLLDRAKELATLIAQGSPRNTPLRPDQPI